MFPSSFVLWRQKPAIVRKYGKNFCPHLSWAMLERKAKILVQSGTPVICSHTFEVLVLDVLGT